MSDDFWKPFESVKFTFENVGDTLVGVITGLSVGQGQRGEYPILKVETKDGEDREVAAPSDLARKLAAVKPDVGDQIAMKLVELRHTGQPQPMKVFEIKHKAAENGSKPEATDDPDAF